MSADEEAGTELELRGALISLRPYRLSDRDVLARIANNRKIWRNLTDRFRNPASMRVLTKAGYTLEAVRPKHIRKDGQLIDVHIYVRLRD